MPFWTSIIQATKSLRKNRYRKIWANSPMRFLSPIGSVRRVKRIFRKSLAFSRSSDAINYKIIGDVNQNPTRLQLMNPLLWIKWLASFALNWLLSRPYGNALTAIPAITLGVGLITVILLSTSDHSQVRASRYRSTFEESVRNHDYKSASLVLRSLMDGSPQNLELQYQNALIEDRCGNTDLAIKYMEQLAMSQDHGMAAMWMISKETNLQEIKSWSELKHARFRRLIEIGLKDLDGENLLSAKVLMFSYLAEIGAYSDAGRYISEVVPTRPELALAAATLCKSQHDSAGFEKYVIVAERHYESELSRQPMDINARINLARTLMIRSRFEDAAKLLNDGYRITKDSRLTGVTGEALLVWSNYLGATDEGSKNLVKRLQILRAAISISPSEPAVGSAIAQLIIDCRDNRSPEVLRLKEDILSGAGASSTHFIRGTLALLDNKFDEAKSHLELALQHDPHAPAILNNLAIAVAQKNASELEKALALVDAALTQLPNHAYFLETRGQILVKLERWQEAIPNLEVALEAKELRPAIYPSLALAYKKIGAEHLTQFYENLAEGSP